MLAIALSIAFNEIAVGLIHAPRDQPRQLDLVMLNRSSLERPKPTPSPTPIPTVRPTPPPVVRTRVTPRPVPVVAAAKAVGSPAPVHGGAPAKAVHHFRNFDVYELLAKSRLGTARGVSGTGTGVAAGLAAGGGANGAGAGNGSAGTGTGTVDGNTPCGDVLFNVHGAPDYQGAAASERVTATVHFPDGHTETETFPYTWTYQNGERDDPWSAANAKSDDDVKLIFPPPGTDTTTFPPLILYVLQHTRPDGTTVLEPCAGQTPLPLH